MFLTRRLKAAFAASAADRLLIEVCHHLLERSIPGLVSFAKLLHYLHRKKEKNVSIAVKAVVTCCFLDLKRPFV